MKLSVVLLTIVLMCVAMTPHSKGHQFKQTNDVERALALTDGEDFIKNFEFLGRLTDGTYVLFNKTDVIKTNNNQVLFYFALRDASLTMVPLVRMDCDEKATKTIVIFGAVGGVTATPVVPPNAKWEPILDGTVEYRMYIELCGIPV